MAVAASGSGFGAGVVAMSLRAVPERFNSAVATRKTSSWLVGGARLEVAGFAMHLFSLAIGSAAGRGGQSGDA